MLIFANGSHTGETRRTWCDGTPRPRVNTTMAEPAERIDTEIDEKYGEFETDDGDLIVYDRDDKAAWLQSNTVSPVEQ
mgnify:CR=1 FL=1